MNVSTCCDKITIARINKRNELLQRVCDGYGHELADLKATNQKLREALESAETMLYEGKAASMIVLLIHKALSGKGARERHEKVAKERDAMREQLREEFAMAALARLCGLNWCTKEIPTPSVRDHAEHAYRYADAILKTRGELNE